MKKIIFFLFLSFFFLFGIGILFQYSNIEAIVSEYKLNADLITDQIFLYDGPKSDSLLQCIETAPPSAHTGIIYADYKGDPLLQLLTRDKIIQEITPVFGYAVNNKQINWSWYPVPQQYVFRVPAGDESLWYCYFKYETQFFGYFFNPTTLRYDIVETSTPTPIHTPTLTPSPTPVEVFDYSATYNSVDLRTYFPETQTTVNSRRSDGSLYSSYIFGPGNSDFINLYNAFFNLNKPGYVYTWQKRYGDSLCTPTYATLFFGEDKSVTEVGDWMDYDGCSPDVGFGYSDATFTKPDGLLWSGSGGLKTPQTTTPNTLEEAKRFGLGVSRQESPGSSYKNFGPNGNIAWNETVILETLPTFTPAYGRSASGIWAKGNAKTYHDVIRVILYHGVRNTSHTNFTCSSQVKNINSKYANLYRNENNYHSYASEFYMAPGKGILQETLLYIEDGRYWGQSNCTMGILFSDQQNEDNGAISYIDE